MYHAATRLRSALPLLALLLAAPLRAQEESPVKARLSSSSPSIAEGASASLELILDIEPGWHVYGPAPKDTGLPTTVAWELPPGFSAGPLEWPKSETFSLAGIESEGYSGTLVLRSRLRAPPRLAIGEVLSIKAKAEWLACKVECMPGEANLAIGIKASAARGAAGLALALLLAFAGGLILNLMPCVLPVLSLKAISFAHGAKEAKGGGEGRGALEQGLFFTAGVLVSFWLFAGLLIALRAGGAAVGWGFQLQEPAFVAIAATLFFLIGLNLFGVFEIGASLTRLGSLGASSFLTGLFATAVATPCTAPFMGVAVGYAVSHNTASALAVFTALGLGMSAPLLAISAFPGLARRLPRAGSWMAVFRQALGFPMMAAVVWMAFVLAGLRGAAALVALLEGLLAAGLGAWAWGTWGGLQRSGRVRAVAAVAALALVAAGAWWPARGAASAPKSPRGGVSEGAQPRADGFWRPWSEKTLGELRKEGRPVFVDFSAAWCLSCQVNEAVALENGAVRARFAELGVATLKADWTARDEAIGRALAALGRASVPVYALYVPGAEAPVLLPELLTPGLVLKYLDDSLARRR